MFKLELQPFLSSAHFGFKEESENGLIQLDAAYGFQIFALPSRVEAWIEDLNQRLDPFYFARKFHMRRPVDPTECPAVIPKL